MSPIGISKHASRVVGDRLGLRRRIQSIEVQLRAFHLPVIAVIKPELNGHDCRDSRSNHGHTKQESRSPYSLFPPVGHRVRSLPPASATR